MGVIDERTPLRKAEGGGPPYMFMTSPNRTYRKQIHQIQCLITMLFIMLFLVLVTITMLHSLSDGTAGEDFDTLFNSSAGPLLAMSWPIADKDVGKWDNGNELSDEIVNSSLSAAQAALLEKDKLEQRMVGLPPNTPSYKHQQSIKTSRRATYLARTGFMLDVATKNALKSVGYTVKDSDKPIGRSIPLQSNLLPEDVCGTSTKRICTNTYRTADGSCNNVNNPYSWGVALQPFRRVLPPNYADDVSEPRKAVDGSDLPSAREVSVKIHRPEYRSDNKFTAMLAVWGQFLDHDITATALSQGKDGGTISCCVKADQSEIHPECFSVSVKSDDPYYVNTSCLEFVRSAPAPTCTLGPREQMNQASSFIDGSVVYGNTDELMASLRSFDNGKLRMTVTPDGQTLLPISTDPNDGCNKEEENAKGRYCFASGDPRANENVHLTTMHLIMARYHNSIATQLSAINPHWDDEKIFQETRKIVGAQIQQITYNEFLPVLLGSEVMKKLDLNSGENGYDDKYQPDIDPTVSNNFATASFRFAHTLLPGMMKIMKNMSSEEQVELHQLLFDPYKLYATGFVDSALLGAMNTPLERLDNYFNKQVTEKLFKQPSKPYGLDLVSLNIQRGRDHGLPGYPAWREHCGLSRPSSFDDLKGVVDQDSLDRISTLYKSVDDVDLYTGALSEYPIEGAMLGPTLTCLIGDQFVRLKFGDKFWFENSGQPNSFTPDQVNALRKATLSKVICETTVIPDGVRLKVMQSAGPDNQQASCQSLGPSLDLTLWSDENSSKEKNSVVRSSASEASAAVGLTVNHISLTTDQGSNWNGQPPIDIPMSVFNGPSSVASHVLPPVIQWTVTDVSELSPLELSLSGSYSVSTSAFSGPSIFNFTQSHSSGKFIISGKLLWNNTDVSSVFLSGTTFTSMLFFSARSSKTVSVSETKQPLKFVLIKPTKPQKITVTKSVTRSSIIMNGNYSLTDKSVFYWSGNVTFTLPLPDVFPDPLSSNVQNSPILTSTLNSTAKSNNTKLLFQVTNGFIEENLPDGSKNVLWNGELPLQIPTVNSFGQYLPAKLSAIVSPLEVSSTLKGTYSVPNYIHGTGFNISWTSGTFSLVTNDSTSLSTIIKPGFKYCTRIILSEVKEKSPDVNDPDILKTLLSSSGNKLEYFVGDALSDVDSTIPIYVILKGSFSLDKSAFYWGGQTVISIKTGSDLKELYKKQKKTLESPVIGDSTWSKNKFGGTVVGGYINTDSGGLFKNKVWSGSVPVAIPVKYSTGVFNRSSYIFSLGVTWSGRFGLGNTLTGTFSLPQISLDSLPYPSVKHISGSFSFNIQPLWNTSLDELLLPGATYYSKINLEDVTTRLLKESGLHSVEDPLPITPVTSELSAPIFLQGSYSPDKTLFYWTGSFIIAFRNGFITGNGINISSKTQIDNLVGSKLMSSKSTQIGAKVVSGNIDIVKSNESVIEVWSGKIPLNIPVSLIQGLQSQNYCAEWSGTLNGTTLTGSFTFPNLNAVDGTVIDWYNGEYKFTVTPLWFMSLSDSIVANKKYCSTIHLQGASKSTNKTHDTVSPVNLGSSTQAVIILKGNYSSDESVFYWFGEAIVSFKDSTVSVPKLGLSDIVTTIPTPTFKPTKKPKPTKGPKPKKSSVSLDVITGSIDATLDGTDSKLVWNGNLPVQIPLDDFIDEYSFTPTAQVSWSGTPTKTTLEGTFNLPVNALNGTMPTKKHYVGNFTMEFQIKWSGDMEALVNPSLTYNCRLLFNEFTIKKMSASPLNQSNGKNILQANGNLPNECNIVLVGTFYKKPFYCSMLPFMCSDQNLFTWSGETILSFVSPPTNLAEKTTLPNSVAPKMMSLQTSYGNPRKIIGKVLSGSLSAGLDGQSSRTLWSGNIPVSIPMPVFWARTTDIPSPDTDNVYGHGAIWSGSVFGNIIAGKFSLPQYTWNGAVSSIRWWSGNFDVNIRSLWDVGIGNLITPGIKFNSKLIFRDIHNYTNLLTSISQDEIDSAYRTPIVLLGTFTENRQIFYWSGNFIMIFYDVPENNIF